MRGGDVQYWTGLKLLQILNEVQLLLRGETETANPVVVGHDVHEGCGAAVVEVRRMLPSHQR